MVVKVFGLSSVTQKFKTLISKFNVFAINSYIFT